MARFAIPVAAARKSRPVSEDDSGSDTSYSSEDSCNNGQPTTATLSQSSSVRSERRTEMLDWTLQLKAAERRTPTGVTSLFRDKWTAVAKSTVGGRGLFAMRKIPAGFALYVYTGVKRTSQDADRYPNAYQLDLNDGCVCDAGDASHSSPARWVNTRDKDLQSATLLGKVTETAQNNCEYEEHNGKLYLVTTRSIKPFQELFASYHREDEGFPEWPQAFLGDGRMLATKYREYLMSMQTAMRKIKQSNCKHGCRQT